jgi:hypothetical protein
MITPTPNEEYIIQILREAKPFEQVIITKDKAGRCDSYLVVRSQKIMISEVEIKEVK